MSRNLPNEITALDGRVTVVESTGGGGGGGLLTFASYAAAKAANYSAVADGTVIYIKGRTATAGGGGVFEVDKTDTTTADNDGTVLVATGGVRLKRFIEDDWIHVNWFADDDRSQAQNWNTALQTVDDVALALNKGVWVDSPQSPGETWLLTETITWRCGWWKQAKAAYTNNGILHGMIRFTPTNPTPNQAAINLDPPAIGWVFSVSIQGPNNFNATNYATWVNPGSISDYDTGFAAGQCCLKLVSNGHGVIENCSFGNSKVGVWVGLNTSATNHVVWRDCTFTTAFGVYLFHQSQDYRFINCGFVECGWAGIMINQLGITESTAFACHFGFAMCGIYQINDTNFTTYPPSDIFGLNIIDCKFEQISECAVWMQPNRGVRGLRFFGGYVGGNDGWGLLPPSEWYGTGPGKIFESRFQYDIRLGKVRDDIYFNGFQNPIGEGATVARVLIEEMPLATARIHRTRPEQIAVFFSGGQSSGWLLAQHFQDYGQRQPNLAPGNLVGGLETLSNWQALGSGSLSLETDPYSITQSLLPSAEAVGGPIPKGKVLVFSTTTAGGTGWDLTVATQSIPAGSMLSCEFFGYSLTGTIGVKPELLIGGVFQKFTGDYNTYVEDGGWGRFVCTGVYAGGQISKLRFGMDSPGTVYISALRIVVGPPAGYSPHRGPAVSQPFAMPSYTAVNLPSAATLPYSEVVISDAVRADSGLGVKAIALQNAGGSWGWYNAADYSRILKTAAQYLSQLTGTYSTAEQNAITAFYSAISSLLPKMAAIYLGRVKNSGDSLINLISNDHTATLESGGPGFTADAGWGTGAGLFNTNFNPVTHGRWTSTSATFGAYYEAVGTGRALNGIAQDASSGGQRVYISPDPGGSTEYALNSPSDSVYTGFAAGLWSVRRSGTTIELYQGATAVDTESNTASSLLNDTLTMTGHGTGYRISMLYIAEGLTAGEISTLNSAYNTLRATL